MISKTLVTSVFFITMFGTAHAAPVTYDFSGNLNDPFGTLSVGTPFSGSFSYDDSQALNTTNVPFSGAYGYTSVSVTINGETVTDNGTGVINVYDHGPDGSYPSGGAGETTGYPTDLFHLYTFSVSGTFGGLTLAPGAGLQVILQDVSGNVFNGPSILGAGLTINDFTLGNATFLQLQEACSADPGYMSAIARGNLSDLSATAVPEPASLILLIPGLGILASMKIRMGGNRG
jgi:hypothetical protein